MKIEFEISNMNIKYESSDERKMMSYDNKNEVVN